MTSGMARKEFLFKCPIGLVLQPIGPSLDLEMHCRFPWPLTIADVSKPIIGADFLRQSDLLVDLARECLLNGQTFYSTLLKTSRVLPLGLCCVAKPCIYYSPLQSFPSLMQPYFSRSDIQHNVTHHPRATLLQP